MAPVCAQPEASPAISKLGYDALLELPAPEALGVLLREQGRRRAIKAVLLDQVRAPSLFSLTHHHELTVPL